MVNQNAAVKASFSSDSIFRYVLIMRKSRRELRKVWIIIVAKLEDIGRTALLLASEGSGNDEIVKILLEAGAMMD
jgi:hypothetical protein